MSGAAANEDEDDALLKVEARRLLELTLEQWDRACESWHAIRESAESAERLGDGARVAQADDIGAYYRNVHYRTLSALTPDRFVIGVHRPFSTAQMRTFIATAFENPGRRRRSAALLMRRNAMNRTFARSYKGI